MGLVFICLSGVIVVVFCLVFGGQAQGGFPKEVFFFSRMFFNTWC